MTLEAFADAVYRIATINPRDQCHAQAIAAPSLLAGRRFVTTHEVLTEVLNAFAEWDRSAREAAARTVERILAGPGTRVMEQSAESFAMGFALYRARLDKGYSLTDCTSMETMRREGITEVLTHDAHFRQEGFTTLL